MLIEGIETANKKYTSSEKNSILIMLKQRLNAAEITLSAAKERYFRAVGKQNLKAVAAAEKEVEAAQAEITKLQDKIKDIRRKPYDGEIIETRIKQY